MQLGRYFAKTLRVGFEPWIFESNDWMREYVFYGACWWMDATNRLGRMS